jgi:tetratricopeptide (TPR) repeat protein
VISISWPLAVLNALLALLAVPTGTLAQNPECAASGQNAEHGKALIEEGRRLRAEGRLQSAEAVLARAVAETAQSCSRRTEAEALFSYASVLLDRERLVEAERAVRRSLALLSAEDGLRPVVLIGLGDILHRTGRLEEADRVMQGVFDRVPDGAPWIAIAYNNLGSLRQSQGRFAEAEAVYRKAIAAASGPSADVLFPAMLNLSNLYLTLGRTSDAEQELERAIRREQLSREPNRFLLARALEARGTLLFTAGEFAAARDCLEEAIRFSAEALEESHPEMCFLRNALGSVYCRLGEAAKGRALIEEARGQMERLGGEGHPALPPLDLNLAEACRQAGDIDAAERAFVRAIAGFEHVGDASGLARALQTYASFLRQTGRQKEARAADKRAEAALLQSDRGHRVDVSELKKR